MLDASHLEDVVELRPKRIVIHKDHIGRFDPVSDALLLEKVAAHQLVLQRYLDET